MRPISEQNSGNEPPQPSVQGTQGKEGPEAPPGERAGAETTSTQNREIVHGASMRDTYLRIRIRGAQESVDSRQSDSRGKLGRNRREQGQLRQPQKAAVPSAATATSAE